MGWLGRRCLQVGNEGLRTNESVVFYRARAPAVHFDADTERRLKVEKVLS